MLDNFHYLFSSKLLKKFIPRAARLKFGPKTLDVILASQCFKGLFYAKVKHTDIASPSNNFEKFYQKYLASALNCDRAVGQSIVKALSQNPYGYVFGMYLIKHRANKAKLDADFKGIVFDGILATCAHFEDFNQYRIAG